MTCDFAASFLQAYIDDELDAADRVDIDEHLRTCGSCFQLHARLDALQKSIRARAPHYRPPDALRRRVEASLRAAAVPATPRRKQVFEWKWAALAAAALLMTLALWQLQLRPHPKQEDLIATEIVSSHVRSLMANHLIDEPSSDHHVVKPWFAGKLNFSPLVKDLDAQGFILAGGRLDYVDGRSVAAIVYRRKQHVINLFVWPSPQTRDQERSSSAMNGFNTVRWIQGGMQYWAISDLNGQELELFSRLVPEPDK